MDTKPIRTKTMKKGSSWGGRPAFCLTTKGSCPLQILVSLSFKLIVDGKLVNFKVTWDYTFHFGLIDVDSHSELRIAITFSFTESINF